MIPNKNKEFILLSRVAKEKKYAQEYLGLLARRGDLGSIRIGKRWYTTREWFEEFLRDSEIKKQEVRIEEMKTEQVQEVIVKKEVIEKKAGERKFESQKIRPVPQESLRCGVSVPLKIQKELPVIDLRKKMPVQLKRNVKSEETLIRREFRNSSPNFLPEPAGRVPFFPKLAQYQNIMSPNFSKEGKDKANANPQKFEFSIFGARLAFGFSGVLVFILLFQAGTVYKEDWQKYFGFQAGTVAGVSDEKIPKVSIVSSSAVEYFEGRLEKIRENFSLSRVLVRAAMERDKKVE